MNEFKVPSGYIRRRYRIEENTTDKSLEYEGYSLIGTASNSPVWVIRKTEFINDVEYSYTYAIDVKWDDVLIAEYR